MAKETVIVGAGPAGISASLYLVRAGFPVTVIYKDAGALGRAHAIENYYGFPEPISGQELFEKGLQQAQRLGVVLVHDEVVGLEWGDRMMAVTKSGAKFAGDVVVLATGASRVAPKLPGIDTYEGKGVSYCAICDGFFYRGKDVAVLGAGDYALHEALVLAPTSHLVTILTNGAEPTFEIPGQVSNLRIDRRKLVRLSGDDYLTGVVLDGDQTLDVTGLFVALGVAGSLDFARKIGAQVDNRRILIDEHCATTLPGLYACGDSTGGIMQVAKAINDGARAALHAIQYLRKL